MFEQKKKRARQREMRIHRDTESSDIDTGPSSSRSSRSVTPLCGHSYSASSPSPINVHGSEQVTSQPHSLSPASSTTLSVVSSQSSTNELKHITSPLSPQPLSPTCCGSCMNLIECTQSTKLNVILSQIALTSPGSIFSAASPWVAF